MKLSIIIVNYNTFDLLKKCLASILKYLPDCEIIIVDNNSNDQEKLWLSRLNKVKVIYNKSNLGFSKANNIGAQASTGELLFFLNPDVELVDPSLDLAIQYYQKNKDVGLLSPKLLNSDQTIQASCFHRQSLLNAIREYFFKKEHAFSKYYPETNDPTAVNSVVGAAMLISRELFDAIGGWNEKYFMYFEDLQLCDDVVKHHKKIIYFPQAKVVHHHGQSISDKKNAFQIQSSKAYHGLLKYYFLTYILYSKTKNLIFLALLLRLVLAFITNYHPDLGNHLDWGEKIWHISPQDFYQHTIWKVSWPNQPPLTIYLFGLMHLAWSSITKFAWLLNLNISFFPSKLIPILESRLPAFFMKLPFVVSDILMGIILYKLTKSLKILTLWLYNPIVIYNSSVWGQTDSLVNLLFLSSFYFLHNNKLKTSILFILLCFSFKLSLLFLGPVWLIMAYQKYGIKLFKSSLLPLAVFFLINLPFIRNSNPLIGFKELYLDIVVLKQGSMLNGNAFNLWGLFYGFDYSIRQNISVFHNITAQQLSYFIFIIVYLFVLVKIKNIYSKFFLVSLLSFIILTNMHERYLYPIFPWFLLLVSRKTLQVKDYIIISILHLINLYNLWFYPDIPILKHVLVHSNFALPRVLSLVMCIFCVKYFIKLKNEK